MRLTRGKEATFVPATDDLLNPSPSSRVQPSYQHVLLVALDGKSRGTLQYQVARAWEKQIGCHHSSNSTA